MSLEEELNDINMDEAPTSSSFVYMGELAIEEWCYLSLDQRTRGGYVKADVPYYHWAFKPLNYVIGDGGPEGDGLEHSYAAIKTAQGELTPKNSAREEMVQAMKKLGFSRNTIKELKDNPAIGTRFKVKRYNRTYTGKDDAGNSVQKNAELMNVPFDKLPVDWTVAPGTNIPSYNRKFRERGAAPASQASGTVSAPREVSWSDISVALIGIDATEEAVRSFILDRGDLAVGTILDAALSKTLLAKLTEQNLVDVTSGKIAVA